ncbi:16961_t:CDS:2, partial [Dentiscutata erythropus]
TDYKAQYAITENYCKKKQKLQDGTIEESFKKNFKDSFTSTMVNINNTRLQNIFATWIINCQCPLVIIEDPEFIKIIQYLNLKAQIIKADAIKN